MYHIYCVYYYFTHFFKVNLQNSFPVPLSSRIVTYPLQNHPFSEPSKYLSFLSLKKYFFESTTVGCRNLALSLISMLCLIMRCTLVIKGLILNSNLKTCPLPHRQPPTIPSQQSLTWPSSDFGRLRALTWHWAHSMFCWGTWIRWSDVHGCQSLPSWVKTESKGLFCFRSQMGGHNAPLIGPAEGAGGAYVPQRVAATPFGGQKQWSR